MGNSRYIMVGGCLIVASHRQSTAGRYLSSGHYQATKARRYVAMAKCLDTVTVRAPAANRRKVNNKGFQLFPYNLTRILLL